MSENLDLVRSIYADWERGDFSSAEWADPEIEFVIADGPEPGRWTGLAGMAEGASHIFNAWEEYRGEVDECRDLDDERVLVLVRRTGRGKASGMDVATKGATLFHIRGGNVTKFVTYWDRERALSDLGLKE
jgi:ketosteroid isomerase-like protein